MSATKELKISSIGESILRCLLYFDIFNYPLTKSEINNFIGCKVDDSTLKKDLAELVKNKLIFEQNIFYSLQNSNELIYRRLKGNEEAVRLMPLALEKAKFIYSFPFIRGIMISGSLSKNYMDEKSDLDFFIITEKNRLWIARTIFDVYRKFFIKKKDLKHYCTNYHISLERLIIDEENIFTATELCTLIPVVGKNHYHQLLDSNPWISEFFPNYKMNPVSLSETEDPLIKRFIEFIINHAFPNQMDLLLQWLRVSWIKLKFQRKYSKTDFKVAFKSKSYVSKVHSTNGQRKILTAYYSNLNRLSLSVDTYNE